MEKGKSKKAIILFIVLVSFDQLLKLYIYKNHMDLRFNIIPGILKFYPIQNTSYSYIGAVFGKVFANYLFNIFTRLLSAYVILRTISYIKYRKINLGRFGRVTLVFLVSGFICSTIDVLVWKGSIDFVELFNWFIFDTKDLYLTIFIIIILYSMLFKKDFWNNIDTDDWEKYMFFKK